MSRHLSIGDRWRIISLYFDQGRSARQIAGVIPCSGQTVCNILQLYEETNNIEQRSGRGRHRMFNNDEIHALRQILYRYPNDTAGSIADRFYRRTGLHANPRTIRNYRRSLGFRPVHARNQPLINATHAQQRLRFCLSRATTQWNDIIFTDEKAFEVDVSGLVYWIPYARRRPTHLQSQVRYRVAVFGGVWYAGRSKLVIIRGRTNTSTYVDHLRAALNSNLRRLRRFYLVHDRPAWAHTALAHNWLINNGISCMDSYPPVSPDLNAVESVWSWMNRYVQRRHPNSQQHLERLVRQAWEEIPQHVICGYISNLSNICDQIIASRGWESTG
jgi:transposase